MSNIYGVARRLASKSLKKYGATWKIGKVSNAGTEERPVYGQPVYKSFSGIYEEKKRMSPDGLIVETRATVVVQPGTGAAVGDPVVSPFGKKYTIDNIEPVNPGALELMSRLWLA